MTKKPLTTMVKFFNFRFSCTDFGACERIDREMDQVLNRWIRSTQSEDNVTIMIEKIEKTMTGHENSVLINIMITYKTERLPPMNYTTRT